MRARTRVVQCIAWPRDVGGCLALGGGAFVGCAWVACNAALRHVLHSRVEQVAGTSERLPKLKVRCSNRLS